MKSLFISVIICTYNRLSYAIKTANVVTKQIEPYTDAELIIVENSETDINYFELKKINFRQTSVHREPLPGLSRARNFGGNVAKGEYLIFLDDDAIPKDSWFLSYYNFICQSNHNAEIVCGKVTPFFGNDDPPWLPNSFNWIYAKSNFGDKDRLLNPGELILGGNFCVSKKRFEDLGGFDEKLGHSGAILGGCEEQDFQARYQEQGVSKIYYIPDAEVVHHFPRERLSVEWAMERVAQATHHHFYYDLRNKGWFFIVFKVVFYWLTLFLPQHILRKSQKKAYLHAFVSYFNVDARGHLICE